MNMNEQFKFKKEFGIEASFMSVGEKGKCVSVPMPYNEKNTSDHELENLMMNDQPEKQYPSLVFTGEYDSKIVGNKIIYNFYYKE